MIAARFLLASLYCFSSGSVAFSGRLDAAYDAQIQYALEHLISGGATNSSVEGTEVMVKPIRTWKSTSGHYCRRYEIAASAAASEPDREELTRGRLKSGGWVYAAGD